jgi:hypothetical protein
LANPEKCCPILAAQVSERAYASGEPAMRAFGGVSHGVEIRRQTNQVVERHHNV